MRQPGNETAREGGSQRRRQPEEGGSQGRRQLGKEGARDEADASFLHAPRIIDFSAD